MECPHCHKEITGKICTACGAKVLLDARYCMQCGSLLETERAASAPDQDDNVDLEDRILCPDGTCTGIIVNGRCSECGKPYLAEGSKGQ